MVRASPIAVALAAALLGSSPGSAVARVDDERAPAGSVPTASSFTRTAVERRVVTLGRSVRGRLIRVVRVGRPGDHRAILVIGCIHGNECAGTVVVRDLARRRPPAGTVLWLVEQLNPDGAAAGVRQNARGVDLNRNFPVRWRPIGRPWHVHHAGPRPFSERESRIARDLILRVRPAATIWYHQALALVDPSTPGGRLERRYARRVGLPLRDLGPLPGVATAWQNRVVPRTTAFVVELPAGRLPARARARHAAAALAVLRA